MGNKVKYGLKNVHYAPITDTAGVITYGVPVKIPGAVNLVANPQGDKSEFYADDIAYFVQNANNGYEGTLELALIPDQFKKDCLGYKEDENGVLFEDTFAVAKPFALLYEFNGDANAIRHVFYNVTAARPNEEGTTKGQTIEVKTETLAITASPAIDTGYVKAKAEPAQAVAYEAWYTNVYEFEAVITP
ncbi:major tail protein [Dehalobacterium formicoaceticum]|uniref:major tail protein n=1 Tax=Dehalobacterium formicoaceticum TaxID=51515 RepID=UPI000B7D8111|nr:major tail protein [Dehalobacterium formicoaceticum]